MKPLFGYGTFRNPAWRRAIFGADYPSRPATLVGWEPISSPSGYLSVRKNRFGVVGGVLVELDEIGWEIADAWEEVPVYHRVDVDARTSEGLVSATIYLRADENGSPLDDDRLALLDDAHVEAAIARFGERMRAIRAATRR